MRRTGLPSWVGVCEDTLCVPSRPESLMQWPEGRAPLGREALRRLTSTHWIARGAVARRIPSLLSRQTTAH